MSIWLCSKSFKIFWDLTTDQDLTTSTTSVYFAKIFCFKSGLLLTTWNSAGISFFIHVDFARLFMVAKWTTRKSYGYLLVNFKKYVRCINGRNRHYSKTESRYSFFFGAACRFDFLLPISNNSYVMVLCLFKKCLIKFFKRYPSSRLIFFL